MPLVTMDTALVMGIVLLGLGSGATVHHATRALGKDSAAARHIPWIVAGLICFNVGSNLVADHLHDRFSGVA